MLTFVVLCVFDCYCQIWRQKVKLGFIPLSALKEKKPEIGTVEWAQYVLWEKHGSCTFNQIMKSRRDAKKNPDLAAKSFRDAFDLGYITLHHANKGKRGRPRYEWRLG